MASVRTIRNRGGRVAGVAVLLGMLLTLGLLSGTVWAHHDHQLENPGGCVDIPVAHQDHSGYDGQGGDPRGAGKKFHGGAHVGAATDDPVNGVGTLGQGNSRVTVAGGSCD